MNILFKISMIFMFVLITNINATQKKTDEIAQISSSSLYNIDKISLQNTIKTYIRSYKKLRALKIVEVLSGKTYFLAHTLNDTMVYGEKLPDNLSGLTLYQSDAKYENEIVGKVYAYYDETDTSLLNQQEIQWIKTNPIIKIAVVRDYIPYDMFNKDNKHIGFHSDLVSLINQKISTNIVLISYATWSEAYESTKIGETNAILSLSWTKQREKEHFIYSPIYHFTPNYLLVHKKNKDIYSLEPTKNKKIAVEDGTIFKNIIQEKSPSSTIVLTASNKIGYEKLSAGEVDALLLGNLDRDLLDKYNVRVASKVYHKSGELHIGTNKKYPIIASILKKGLDSLSLKQRDDLRKKWFRKENTTSDFTLKEKEWIKNNPIVKIGLMDYWVSDDTEKNIHTELLKLINKYSDLELLPVRYNKWKNGFQDAKEGKVLHGILNLSWTKEREKNSFYYTKAYNFTPSDLIVRKDNIQIQNIKDLKNKKVYIRNNTITSKTIQEQVPTAKIIYFDDEKEIYKKMNKSKDVDAILDYSLDNGIVSLNNLKVVQNVYDKYSEVSIGVSKKHQELASILEKIYSKIPKNELLELQNKKYFKSKIAATIQLTDAEKNWIINNPVVNVTKFFNEPPFTINTLPKSGYMYELLECLTKSAGLKIKYNGNYSSYSSMLDDLEKGKVDILTTFPSSFALETNSTIVASKSVLKTPFIVVGKANDTKIHSIENLFGHKVSVVKGYAQDKYLDKFPQIKKVYVRTNEEGFESIRSGKAQYYINNRANTEYVLNTSFSTDLRIIHELSYTHFPPLSISFAMDGTKTIMVSILQKALDQMSYKDIKNIQDKWMVKSSKLKENSTSFDIRNKKENLNLLDILPIKEILIGFLIFLIIFYLIWKYQIQSSGKEFALKGTLFFTIGAFLFIASFISIITINNLEKVQKNEIKESLKTVLNSSYKTIKIWLDSKYKKLDIVLEKENIPLLLDNVKDDKNKKELDLHFKMFEKVFENSKYYLLTKELEIISSSNNVFKNDEILHDIQKLIVSNANKKRWLSIPHKDKEHIQENILLVKSIKYKDTIVGYLVMQIDPQEEFTKILQNGRIGESGETYAFNEYLHLISNSRFDNELKDLKLLGKNSLSFLNIKITTSDDKPTYLAKKALEKSSGIYTQGYKDYRDIEVYGAWIWDDELKVAFATEIDKDEAMGAFNNMKNTILIIVFSIILFTIFLTLLIVWISKQSKKSLEKSNKELNKLLNSFDENVIASRADIHGNITYASKAFANITGYTVDELMGKPHSLVRHSETPKKLFKELWQTILAGEIFKGKLKNRKKDGGFYWVDVVISPDFSDDGKVIGFSAIRHDITAQKEVEELTSSLELKVEQRTKDIEDQKKYIDSIMNSQSNIVISTDGIVLRTANKSFLEFFAIESKDEFIEKFGECICDTFDEDTTGTFIQKSMDGEKWIEYIFDRPTQLHKTTITRGEQVFTFSITSDKFEFQGEELMVAVFTDITELEKQKKQTEEILASILLPTLITDKETRKIVYANSFANEQYESSNDALIGLDIDYLYTDDYQKEKILNHMKEFGLVKNFETKFKTLKNNNFDALLSLVDIEFNGKSCYLGVASDITKQKLIEQEVRSIHKHTKDSIEYAALIQSALIPDDEVFDKYFQDFFTIWQPKDIVGGDIYLFEELRNNDECLLMVIDCTGHGVPGAFVTMLVKAIERQVIAKIENDKSIEVSPAWILSYFNKTMKKLLKQESDTSISNAGFDGGVLYYNKKENYVKYAGAETPLFYIQNEELNMIKGDRHSVGYKKSDISYAFSEYKIDIDTNTQIYITTDGYLDQNGGAKSFPFGKRKFKELLINNQHLEFKKQKDVLLTNIKEYMKEEDRNDDTTVVGINITKNSM